jgi:hypothetical protein
MAKNIIFALVHLNLDMVSEKILVIYELRFG